jgi:hypothetical protein
MESIVEKIKKIQALAERGVSGEAKAAKAALEKLLKKYNLTLEDLSRETVKKRCFVAKNDNEKAVLIMCGFKIVGEERVTKLYSYKGRPNSCYLDLNDYEFIELSQLFDFHKKNINNEFEKVRTDFQRGYQYKHKLYSSSKTANEAKVTKEDVMRILRYASEMKDVEFYKAIAPHGST